MTQLSREFLVRLKLGRRPAYEIAQEAGINPSALSRLINGIDPLRPGDERILKVAKVLGLSEAEALDDDKE